MAQTKEEFEFGSKEEVEAFMDNIRTQMIAFALKKMDPEQFSKAVNQAEDFEEYVGDFVVKSKEKWLEMAGNFDWKIKSFQPFYDIGLWHKRHFSLSFVYIYTFVDDTSMVARGEATAVVNSNGELSRWLYFSKDGSLEKILQKNDELAAAAQISKL